MQSRATAAMTPPEPRSAPTRHLDLGCGAHPRNPYGRNEVHGVDIAIADNMPGVRLQRCNVTLEPLPFPDSHFDSLSAFDFLEHVPRLLPTADGASTRLPFIELMNECWRVLKPDGRFYAVTPCYPSPIAFQDPTHVNIITDQTHEYFCGPQPLGRMYGFSGQFDALRIERVVFRDAVDARAQMTLHQRIRRLNYRRKGQLGHLCWEFRAVKPAAVPQR
jgi:SAM-dependent methyltransferase